MHPQTEISNGLVQAKVYLPDPEHGYYRATRFDWSGVIGSLACHGHEYFSPWFEHHDPKKHDGIVGPVEEFQASDGGPGYAEAPAGGVFLRIGVGLLRKPDEAVYRRFGTYDIVDPGVWAIRKGRDWIEFNHAAADGLDHGYEYRKTISLSKDTAELSIEHWLKNTGQRPIQTEHYNHNFFVINGEPSGPGFVVRFPFEVRTTGDLKGLMEIQGTDLVYLQELQKGQSVLVPLEGFGVSSKDHDIVVENRRTGAGVRIQGDQPLSSLMFWSIRATLCPEPYVAISVGPGGEKTWKTRYTFYAISAQGLRKTGVLPRYAIFHQK
jgi:hypothetical protein